MQVFGLEVFIYTTKQLTTLFVSKADSTGYLHLLNLPPGTPPPIKTITTTFLRYLIEHRTRPGKRLVLSLFARAQNQYLFPGSVENSHKHVLDDRGLIKWWCRVTDPLLEEQAYGLSNGTTTEGQSKSKALAYLRVPGYDPYETRTFFPRNSGDTDDHWKAADPLVELASPNLPERCLIPRFPDDPKARFLDTLDEELPDEENPPSQSMSQETLERVNNGRWRSIRSLDQFWEAMSYRQECSSGRLVGFLWAVFTPSDFHKLEASGETQQSAATESDEDGHEVAVGEVAVSNESQDDIKPPQTGPDILKVSEAYHWPEAGRGEVVVPQTEYDEIDELLMSLDYANQSIAVESTGQWSQFVAKKAGVESWGKSIIGEHVSPSLVRPAEPTNGATNMLSAGLVRKKKRPIGTVPAETNQNAGGTAAADVSLSKKQKTNGLDAVPKTSVVSQVEG